jgi:hypothetical protein
MAQVPYSGGISDVKPADAPPTDYINARANPSEFGGLIAEGGEKLGQGALDLGKFQNNVKANDAANNAEQEASNFLEHIRTLQGRDRQAAQDTAYQNLDAIQKKWADTLQAPESQYAYSTRVMPYFNKYVRGSMNTSFVEADKQVADTVATDGFNGALSTAADAGSRGDWGTVGAMAQRGGDFQRNLLAHQGMETDPGAQAAAERKGALAWKAGIEARVLTDPDDAWKMGQSPLVRKTLGNDYLAFWDNVKAGVARAYVSRADAIEATDPAKAAPFVEANKEKFDTAYGSALLKAQHAGNEAVGGAAADKKLSEAKAGPPAAGALPADDPGARPGYSYEGAVSGHESGGSAGIVNTTPVPGHPEGSGASGLFQFLPSSARALQAQHPELGLQGEWWHDASPEGVAMQRRAFAAFTADNRAYLQKNGIEPNDKNTFMGQFLGPAGAARFIKEAQEHANAPAAALFPAEAAANPTVFYSGGPGGSSPRSLAQVYALMTKRFSGKASVVGADGVSPPASSSAAGAAPLPEASSALAPDQTIQAAPPVSSEAPVAVPSAPEAAGVPGSEVKLPEPPAVIYDPYGAALHALKDDSSLTDQQKDAGYRRVAQQRSMDQLANVDQERAQKLYKDAREQASGQAEKEIIADLTSNKPVNTVQTIGQNKALTPSAQLRMIDFAKTMVGTGGEASTALSQATTVRLMQDIGRPFGDPEKITTTAPLLDAFNAHQLRWPDFDRLSKQVEAAKSEDGEKLSTARTEFMKSVVKAIDKSNPLAGKDDALGAQMAYRYTQDLNAEIDWAMGHGKNPFDLFNPGSSNYFGKPQVLAKYMTTDDDEQKYMIAQATGAPPPFPPYKPFMPGWSEPAPASPLPDAAPAPLEKPTRRPGELFSNYETRVNAFIAAKRATAASAVSAPPVEPSPIPGNFGGF